MSTSEQSTQTLPAVSRGSFSGVEVHAGRGGGLASRPPVTGKTTHYHAARLPEFGDVVLAVTRSFDPDTGAAISIELRAFAAASASRGALVHMALEDFNRAAGAIGFAQLSLARLGDAPDERRPARLTRCTVSDAAPTAEAARGIADWMRNTWETELAFGSWPALQGSLDAFAE
ncbi:MAG: hypothetical protein JWN41_1077, partial [Thermoleophilia bacterium]|nr:hypothetical protein [Thermoleophilia bacterium]